MRRREMLLYAGIALLVLAFLIYSPVLYLWGTRRIDEHTHPATREVYGTDRKAWIEKSWILQNIQRPYHSMLVFHAEMCGWFLDDYLPNGSLYRFLPDTPGARQKSEQRKIDYPPVNL